MPMIQMLGVIAALVATGYGFAAAGLIGALTGFVAAVGTGSGLAIAFAERGAGVATSGASRAAQRFGGVVAAVACLGGAYHGGWRLGWAWGAGGYAVGVLAALAVARRHRNHRAQFTVTIPVSGPASLQLTPHDASPDDLSLLALCYGSKVRWLLLTEPECIPEIFQELCSEAIDFWSEPGADLIDRMPSARRLRANESGPHAVAGGERFVVTLYRTDCQNLRNKAWVITTIPRPGLAANLPWSFLLVLNAVFLLLKPSERDTLRQALAKWCERAFGEPLPEGRSPTLNALFEVSIESWLHAKTNAAA